MKVTLQPIVLLIVPRVFAERSIIFPEHFSNAKGRIAHEAEKKN